MSGQIVGSDPVTGQFSEFSSFAEEEFAVQSKQKVDDIVKRNKRDYRDSDGHFRGDEPTHIARIPITLYWKLHREGIAQDEEKFRKWLDDPDNRHFRTHPGRMSR